MASVADNATCARDTIGHVAMNGATVRGDTLPTGCDAPLQALPFAASSTVNGHPILGKMERLDVASPHAVHKVALRHRQWFAVALHARPPHRDSPGQLIQCHRVLLRIATFH